MNFGSYIADNVVGYQNKSFGTDFNYTCNTFIPVGGDAETMTLGEIKANDEFIFSTIDFLTNGGANNMVEFGGEMVYESYTYWADPDWTAAGVAGWYLVADEEATVPMNDKVVPFGSAFCVTRDFNEDTAQLIFAGQVATESRVLNLGPDFNYIGNCAPKAITLGDITASDEFIFSTIDFLTNGGANNMIEFGGEMVYESYTYWADPDWTAAGVAGWYLVTDEEATVPMNDKIIEAGSAFCVTRDFNEDAATISLPAAL